MTRTEFDNPLCDYVGGVSSPAQKVQLEQRAAVRRGSGEFLPDVSGATGFLTRVSQLEPPPKRVTRMSCEIPVRQPPGPLERCGILSRFFETWRPALQPRFAMGVAITILSFAMLDRCTGVHLRHIEPADLSPVRIWNGLERKAMCGKYRALKYYDNLRLVYEVETRLNELREQQDASTDSDRKAGPAAIGSRPQPTPETSPFKVNPKN